MIVRDDTGIEVGRVEGESCSVRPVDFCGDD
jgi:hypothetical protein